MNRIRIGLAAASATTCMAFAGFMIHENYDDSSEHRAAVESCADSLGAMATRAAHIPVACMPLREDFNTVTTAVAKTTTTIAPNGDIVNTQFTTISSTKMYALPSNAAFIKQQAEYYRINPWRAAGGIGLFGLLGAFVGGATGLGVPRSRTDNQQAPVSA